jgi:hypothetical protein
MFARRLSVQLKPNKFAEFTKTLEKDIIPLLRRQEGFKDEITFAAPDGIEVLAISLWDTRANAAMYDASIYKDVLRMLGTMIAGTPEVATTEVMHSTFHHIRAGAPVALSSSPDTGPLHQEPSLSEAEKNIMNSVPNEKRAIRIEVDRILASAVVLSWQDLLHATHGGLIHIEYAPGKTLQYLKVWELTGKGEWSLVCEYWMSCGPAGLPRDGMTFSNDYHSAGLTDMLELIMQHQDRFSDSLDRPGAGLIQVTLPTAQESLAATACMRQAYESLGLTFAHIPKAAVA